MAKQTPVPPRSVVVLPSPASGAPAGPAKLTVADLESSQEWLRLVAESSTAAIFVHTGDSIVWANPATSTLSGYSNAELLALAPLDLVAEDAREFLAARWSERLVDGDKTSRRYQVRLRRKDGREIWIDASVTTFEYRGCLAGLGTAIDITELKVAEAARRASEERLELAQQAADIVSWDWDVATDDIRLSSHGENLLGLANDETISADQFFARVHPQDAGKVRAAVRRALEDGVDFFTEHRVVLAAGQTRWIAERGQVLRDATTGEPRRMIGVSLDITHRKLAEEALFQEKERAQVTLASIGDGVIRTDSRAMIDYMNPAAERLTGWRLHEAYGRHLRDVFRVIDPKTHTPLLDPVTRCLAEGRGIEFPGERLLEPRHGPPIAIRDSASPILARTGRTTGAVLAIRDVSELRSIEQERSFFSSHDALTGLANRRAFEEEIERAVVQARAEPVVHAVGLLDLDQFRLVNETCGHFAGDEILKQVAQRLAAHLSSQDVLARLGSDEFGILFRERDLPEALQKAQELRRSLQEARFVFGDRVFEILGSIGIVPVDSGTMEGAALLAAADAACSVAKERGGNRVHEYRPSDIAIAQRVGQMQWIQKIHQAFEHERFRLFAQRIVPLGERETEALSEIFIRMLSEQGEILPTPAFIAAAERYHLISTMDRWVIRESFGQLGAPPREGSPIGSFTINLSGQSLGEEALLEQVLREIDKSRVDPRRICFEITETAAIANLTSALRFISALKNIGVRFVLDDFGSGFSSFAYLKNLPVDFLKIDASFTRQLATDRIQRALVESIQQLGRVLGMKTIAEGVEDETTIEVLRDLGVDYAQGFALHRPEPLVVTRSLPGASL